MEIHLPKLKGALIKKILDERVFERFVILSKTSTPGTIAGIFDSERNMK